MASMGGAEPQDFEDDETGWAKRWKVELDAANKELEPYRVSGAKVDKHFRDERDTPESAETRWNLFTSDVLTLVSMLYGNTPKASVTRRFADSDDDAARVAGEMLERILHTDIEKRSDTAAEAFGNALLDWLVPGTGVVRVRYEMESSMSEGTPPVLDEATGEEVAPAVPPVETKTREDAPIDFVHWRDFLWSPARVWSEVAWLAFANDLPKGPFVKRFGEDKWKLVPKESKRARDEEKENDPWARVRVWEIWHKETRKVFWYVDGYSKCLDVQDDTLQLEGFWPCPKPLFANLTTSKLVPRPDYVLAQDLYLEINRICSRIDKLQRAIKVVGAYAEDSTELRRILEETVENQLLPVKQWGAFMEKGGITGALQLLPLEPVVAALNALRDYRRELIDALYQVTGRSDIMRGQASAAGSSATEQAIKAKFGSVRVQRRQDEFARFVSEAQALKAEIICKHFSPETILEKSNALYAFKNDQQHVQAAVELLQKQHYCYRVEVKPESVSLTDFATLKQDRTEVIGALSQFLTAAAPMAQAVPGSMKFLLQLLQTTVAGLRGSSTMEGVLDAAIEDAEKQEAQRAANPQQPPPDPKVQAAQLKMQADQQKGQFEVQKEQMKLQHDLTRIQAETQAKAQQEDTQRQSNVREAAEKQMISHSLRPPMGPGEPP